MASNPQHEPTMEEILASIRKIISEDSAEQPQPAQSQPAVQASTPAPEPEAAEPEEAEVLELTQEVHEEPAPAPEPVAAPEPPPAPAAETTKSDDIVFEDVEEEEEQVEEEEAEPAPAVVAAGGDIFSDKSRKALDDAFAKLEPVEPAPHPDRDTAAAVAPVDGASVEAVFDRAIRESFEPVLKEWLGDNSDQIVDRMKPVIREWLDEHFPALLEDAVRGEVARVVKARGRR